MRHRDCDAGSAHAVARGAWALLVSLLVNRGGMGSLSPLLLRVLRFDVLDCRSTCGSSSPASSSESPTLVDLWLTASSTLMTLGSSALSMVRLL